MVSDGFRSYFLLVCLELVYARVKEQRWQMVATTPTHRGVGWEAHPQLLLLETVMHVLGFLDQSMLHVRSFKVFRFLIDIDR